MTIYPQMNLSPEATPWGRAMQERLELFERELSRRAEGETNANQLQNGTLTALGNNIVDLDGRMQDALNHITIDGSQVATGKIPDARLTPIDQSVVTGTWTKDVNTANVGATSVFAANAGNINGNITASRTTLWARNSDGYIGNTLSSIRFKTGVVDTDIDPLAVLGIAVKHYRYIAEVRKRDDPSYEGYIGPDYHVALEVGMIAEDLHAAGLWQFVAYERETVMQDDVLVERLRLDSAGNPIPESIHYNLWGMAVLVATQHVWAEHLKLAGEQAKDRADIDRILEHLGI